MRKFDRVYSAAMGLVRGFVKLVVVVAVLIVAAWIAAPFAARHLIRSDALAPSDLIVVLGSYRTERAIEAADLYRQGLAPRVMLLKSPDVVRDRLRRQLGLHVPTYIDIQRQILMQLQVPAGVIDYSPDTNDSTRLEATKMGAYCRQKGYRQIIIVTSPYHTQRAGALFDRAAHGSFRVIVHPDRYEKIDPDRWWLTGDRTDVVLEYMKRVYALFVRG
jgi:uncharacterized SAM-binding protein YcdF (DUF218 family)